MARSYDDTTEYGGRSFAPYIIIFCVFLLIAVIGFFILLHSSVFNISCISVYGCSRYSAQDIIDISGISYDMNIVALNKEEVKNAIEQNPYLRVDSIKRKFPTEIEIYITERESAAQIFTQNGYYIIDKDCTVLALLSVSDPTLPTVIDLGIAEPTFGDSLSVENGDRLSSLTAVLYAIDKFELTENVTSINVTDPNRIKLVYNNRFSVYLAGAATVEKKLSRLKAIVEVSGDRLTDGAILNLETEDNYYIKQNK